MNSEYLTVSQAAARLGLKERTIQKYCASGKLTARRVSTPTGDAWQIDRASFEAIEAANNVPNERTNEHRTNGERTPKHQSPNSKSSERTPNAQGTERTPKAESLAQSREEVLFLRGLVEQHQRSEAELRAALRKALDAMPLAITAGNESAPIEAAAAPENTQAKETTQPAKQAAQRGAQRKIRPWQRAIMRMIKVKL
jgi:excisionase family DNA binding protein